MSDERSDWQKWVGIGERARARKLLRETTEITTTGAIKTKVEYTDGRVDNYYTLPTQEVGTCQPDFQ